MPNMVQKNNLLTLYVPYMPYMVQKNNLLTLYVPYMPNMVQKISYQRYMPLIWFKKNQYSGKLRYNSLT